MFQLKARAPKWSLTEDTFRELLRLFHGEPDEAARLYEDLRLKLNMFFESRKCAQPEALADETINRLAQKIDAGEKILSISSYAFAVAKYIYLESQRKPAPVSLEDCRAEDDVNAAQRALLIRQEQEFDEVRSECMRKCLAKLPEATRNLLIEYYCGTGRELAVRRQQMADRMRMTPNALYIKVHRVREKLEESLAESLNRI